MWNTAVCAAVYGPLQALEVELRNAMHRQLAACYGEEWYDNPAAGLDRGTRATGELARRLPRWWRRSRSSSGSHCSGRRTHQAGRPQGRLREDALAAGAPRRVSPPPRAPDAPTGPEAAGRAARAAEPDRAPRACLREALARGPRPHTRGDRLDLASRAGVDRAAQPRAEAARRRGCRRDRRRLLTPVGGGTGRSGAPRPERSVAAVSPRQQRST